MEYIRELGKTVPGTVLTIPPKKGEREPAGSLESEVLVQEAGRPHPPGKIPQMCGNITISQKGGTQGAHKGQLAAFSVVHSLITLFGGIKGVFQA